MQSSSNEAMGTRIEIDITEKEDIAISEAAVVAGVTRDHIVQQALVLLLRDIKYGEAAKESIV
jgi:hypothetical protein